ncbi:MULTISPECIES: tetratricopeptide repeat protein [unclassified Acidovorax]|uniref:tetratricopeptide repeat protein n=1 Tax=unclassified Acidovorax TaxID=2684926 RepID=UPI000A9AB13D|nr:MULTISPECIES: tetratricopeptide repeat protein [unclassified Acidovorax]
MTNPEYRAAVFAATAKDYTAARAGFNKLIAQSREAGDNESLGFFLHNLGEMEARAGCYDKAHELYREAALIDPLSPQPLLFYAQSLISAFEMSNLAESVLQEAEQRLTSPDFDTSRELPRSYYLRQFELLREEICRAARDP